MTEKKDWMPTFPFVFNFTLFIALCIFFCAFFSWKNKIKNYSVSISRSLFSYDQIYSIYPFDVTHTKKIHISTQSNWNVSHVLREIFIFSGRIHASVFFLEFTLLSTPPGLCIRFRFSWLAHLRCGLSCNKNKWYNILSNQLKWKLTANPQSTIHNPHVYPFRWCFIS